ncbi:Uncharacterised protein [uncultured archaeon]|nr:Uncharacterised protein [uncultured archaeon]
MPVTLKTLYKEIKTLRSEVELIRSTLIPEEEISDEERVEIHRIREEMKHGKKFKLDDVLAE